MAANVERVADLLEQILVLHKADSSKDEGSVSSSSRMSLLGILTNYHQESGQVDTSAISEYVYGELSLYYVNMGDTEDNFDVSNGDLWEDLLNIDFDPIILNYAIAMQIILNLTHLSLVNKQKLAELVNIKSHMVKILEKTDENVARKVIAELYCQILSTNCEPTDILQTYNDIPKNFKHYLQFLNTMGNELSDPYSQCFLDFENTYELFHFTPKGDRFTIQLWIMINNLTSCRILTINQNTYLEIKQSTLCISNDEFILALFQNFEFECDVIYHLSLNVEGDKITLYVDGNHIESISLIQNSIKDVKLLELGSMICSFRLYKMWVWSELLYETTTKLINQVGLFYHRAADQKHEWIDFVHIFGEHILQEVYKSIETPGVTLGICKLHIKQLNYDNLAISLDPREFIQSKEHDNTGFILNLGGTSDVGIGKCYYYKQANILACFKSVNALQRILNMIDECQDQDMLYGLLENLFILLKCPELKSSFEKELGYALLGSTLTKSVLPKLKTTLPIQFLNLFLEFCGWKITDPSWSILMNENAYDNLVLNFELWISSSRGGEQTASIEIIRFLFFQVAELVRNSKFSCFNARRLKTIGVIDKLICHQHLVFTKNPNENFLDALKDELSEVYTVLLGSDLTQKTATSLCYFAYYELRQCYFKSGEIILSVLDTVLFDGIELESFETINILAASLPIKLVLMMMDYSYASPHILELLLQILLKLLQVNTTAYQKFIKNNGFSLLFEIIKKYKLKSYVKLINILRLYSLGEYLPNDDLPPKGALSREGIGIQGDILMVENHYLALDLIEWAVINDITEATQEDMNDLIVTYMGAISDIQDRAPLSNLLNPKRSAFLEKTMDILMTLRKPQNGVTYNAACDALIVLLSNNVFNCLTTLKQSEFEDYFDSLLKINSQIDPYNGATSNYKPANYLKPAFWINVFPDILERLVNFAPTFDLLFSQYDQMFANIIHVLEKYTETLALFEWDVINYVLVHKCIISAAEAVLKLPNSNFRSATKNNLIQTEIQVLIALFFLMMNDKFPLKSTSSAMFFESILFHQETLFGIKRQFKFFDKEFISYFLCLLGKYISQNEFEPCSLALNCFRTIVLHYSESLPEISSLIDRSCKDKIQILLEQTMSSDDEDIYESLKYRDIISMFEHHLARFHKKFIKGRLLDLSDNNLLTAEKTMSNLLHLKQMSLEKRYCNLIKIHNIFHVDSIAMDSKILSIEEKKLSHFINDLEDELVLYTQRKNQLKIDCLCLSRFQDDVDVELVWCLDSMENSNRMKKRLVPKYKLPTVIGQDKMIGEEDETIDNSQRPQAINSGRRCSSVMSFELISDLEAFDLNILDSQDKNRKILKILKENDSIKQIWNCSRVIGLTIHEGVLIMSLHYLYFISNYFFSSKNKNIIDLRDAPKNERDNTIKLISGMDRVDTSNGIEHEVQYWDLSKLIFVTKRPFLLRDLAIEFLFESGKNCFFTFHSKSWREDAYQKFDKIPKCSDIDIVLLTALSEINARNNDIGIRNGLSQSTFSSKVASVFSNPVDLTQSFDALKRWKNGEISNFYYLMIVNTLAGRTFNDLTQYPVFPWVISDYTSEELNLDNPKTFRDLSKPMGAQSKKRRNQFIERFEALASLEDPDAPPFHYGTHYSSAMIVSSYLMRLEPFVNSYLILQDGKFGHADRLFNNIERAWCSASCENTTDVRELIPEFYYLPDFLKNINEYNLGTLQSGEQVNDVILPRWAKGDPKIFIEKNREALESPYVSQHIHEWIDLIFGYKQKGKESIEAVNVFNKLSYPGAVNLDKINDENERRAITGIIHNFGQTPLQIFDSPHPAKITLADHKINENVWQHIPEEPIYSTQVQSPGTLDHCIKHIGQVLNNQGTPSWKGYPFWYRNMNDGSGNQIIKIQDWTSISIGENVFFNVHFCPITSLEIFKNNQFITGDKSGLLKLWEFSATKNSINAEEVTPFYGHLHEIMETHASPEYNTFISLDTAGNLYCWDILKSEIIRQVSHRAKHSFLSVATGSIAVVDTENKLSIYDLNGSIYAEKQFEQSVTSVNLVDFSGLDGTERRHIYWKQKEIVTVGLYSGDIDVLELSQASSQAWTLKHLKTLKSERKSPITSIYSTIRVLSVISGKSSSVDVTKCEIVAGNADGFLYVWR